MDFNGLGGLQTKLPVKRVASGGGGGANTPGYFWMGADGNVYVQGANGINSAGKWDANTAKYWSSRGFTQTPNSTGFGVMGGLRNNNTPVVSGGGGGGYSAPAKVLDEAQLRSIDALLASLDVDRGKAKEIAAKRRDANLNEKREEKKREEKKYKGKKINVLQEFAGAKTDTDMNTRTTLENLMSSLSTLGLGGSRALTRQILDAANMANRKANFTQATDNQNLDSAWNDFSAANENDLKKIQDQFGYDAGEADRQWGQARQNALIKKADIYGAADRTAERNALMDESTGLSSLISNSRFVNPSYTGKTREMATPELGDYTQSIGTYNTAGVGGGVTPAGGKAPGNLAIKAMAVNDKDLGVKKKTENDLGYGV